MSTRTVPGASSAQAQAQARAAQLSLNQPPRSFWGDAWLRFRHDRLALAGSIVFLFLCLVSLAAPLISTYVTGYEPDRINMRENYQPPSAQHWFGTDDYGRDYLTRTVYAGRVSLSIGFLVASISLTIGVALGLMAGYYGGWFDDAMQAGINILTSIPFLPLLVIIGSLVRLSWVQLAILLGVLSWPGACRQVRALVLSLRQRDFVVAAQTVGARDRRILIQHLLPNVFSIVLVIVGFDVVGAILQESALSFLGFGVAPPTATWGNMLSNSLAYTRYPWLVFFPGLAISLTVLSIFLIADGLRDAMDPRLRR
jgi:peptide/nickel transport system permease protein